MDSGDWQRLDLRNNALEYGQGDAPDEAVTDLVRQPLAVACSLACVSVAAQPDHSWASKPYLGWIGAPYPNRVFAHPLTPVGAALHGSRRQVLGASAFLL